MSDLFLNILNMSIAASWLILAVVLLRFVLKKAPKWIAVLLWGIVALRLAVPCSFKSALSLIPSAETFNAHNIQYETPAISSGIPAVNNAVNPVLGETFAPNSVGSINPLYIWTLVVSAIWLVGIAAMLLYAVISYVRVRQSVAERVPYEGNIFLCDYVKSPFILGLVRPKIYLPSSMDEAAMGPVIAHEKAHLARRDHWWKPLGFLILTVHWFNPLCWVTYVLLCRDIELACDEKVIRQMDLDEKKQYSIALLECSTGRRLVTICPLAFGAAGIKARVKNVLNYKKPAFGVVAAAVVACTVVTVIFATNPVKKQPPMNDLQLISADVMNLRSDPPILYSMNTSELDELSSRLKDINMTGVDDDLMGMTPYYSITITDQKVEGFSVSGFDTDGNHVGILYQGHYYRVQDDDFSRYLQNICAGYQRADALPRLTLDDVVTLSKKGNTLSWSDFERYQGWDVGSGLYIMRYEIDELFDVLVGGVPDETPWYIYLRVNNEADDRIDIRTEDVSTFVEAHRNDVPKVIEPKPDGGGEPAPEEPDFSTLSEEQAAIRQAILEHNRSADLTGVVPCVSFAELASFVVDGSDFAEYIHYGWALYEEYRVTDSGLETVTGSHAPVAITFREDPSGALTLEEYWQPRDGSYYAQDIREKFPVHIVEDGMDSQKFILQKTQECYAQAVAATGLDTDQVIGSLIETICSGPALSSNPGDYIEAHPIEYRELTYYGRYTLKYCFTKFLKGGQTDLRGHIMRAAMDDIAPEAQLKLYAETGQEYFDAWKDAAKSVGKQHDMEWIEENQPAIYLLLQMISE
ncbi:M56 family metallopeptidase [uncultured Oscillibacter sp.]|uniref:M56 family metallopeptidase n=1 Tax=uncultured Oscillibacter sp. TaxID=876091 RepID=UPI00272AE49F|nr:M56 family metallopeptidase [uncultured Oscillibacter sp.]